MTQGVIFYHQIDQFPLFKNLDHQMLTKWFSKRDKMKHLTLTIVTVLLLLSVANSQEIKIAGDKISFAIPDDFTKLAKEELDLKYPSKHAPNIAYANKTRSVSITYNLKTTTIPPEALVESELPNAQNYFAQNYTRVIPGIRWIDNKIITIYGKKWIYFELLSNAIDTDIRNIMLITFYDKKLLMFNFNSTVEDFEKYKTDLTKSIDSIKILENHM